MKSGIQHLEGVLQVCKLFHEFVCIFIVYVYIHIVCIYILFLVCVHIFIMCTSCSIIFMRVCVYIYLHNTHTNNHIRSMVWQLVASSVWYETACIPHTCIPYTAFEEMCTRHTHDLKRCVPVCVWYTSLDLKRCVPVCVWYTSLQAVYGMHAV